MSKQNKPTFESNIKRLEEIVDQLEKGEIDLETSLKLYEEGAQLVSFCQKQLTEAETRIEKLKPQNGGLTSEPFEEPEEQE